MDHGSPLDLILVAVLVSVGSSVLVAVHEIGHALAARARGLEVYSIRVGAVPQLKFAIGSVQIELGKTVTLRHGVRGGEVKFAAQGATPADLVVVMAGG